MSKDKKAHFGHSTKQELHTFGEFIGLPGFIMMSSYNALYPNQRQGKDVYLQGSRQMDSVPGSLIGLRWQRHLTRTADLT